MAKTATVLGASGYGGGELLRYLQGHPGIDVLAASGASRAGEPLAKVHPQLAGAMDLDLVGVEDACEAGGDVVFSCLPGGELPKYLEAIGASLVVDLADDFRGAGEWVYGLSEFKRNVLAGASLVANPGCYPTASLLALLPFAQAGVVEPPFVIDAISGVSGAGRKLEDRLLLASAAGSAGAYGSLEHRHVPEIERALAEVAGIEAAVSFTPHLAPMERGLVVTVRARLSGASDDSVIEEILKDAYAPEPFVEVVDSLPQTKPLAGTNRAHVFARADGRTGWLVASAAIDNLGKGAAGQALQNANLALGLDETAGLMTWGVWP